jgi:hypothetical protein
MRCCLGFDLHRPPVAGDDFTSWWVEALRATPSTLRRGTSSMILLTAWWIWEHRNAAIFDNTRPSVASLLDTDKAEARAWTEAGGRGVRELLP